MNYAVFPRHSTARGAIKRGGIRELLSEPLAGSRDVSAQYERTLTPEANGRGKLSASVEGCPRRAKGREGSIKCTREKRERGRKMIQIGRSGAGEYEKLDRE